MQKQNSSCQQPRELTDEKNLYAYPFSLYETLLCEALSLDQWPETFLLQPFADSAHHIKEHTQERLQSLPKLFSQFFNRKKDVEKFKKENLYCCIIYIKTLWQSQAYY